MKNKYLPYTETVEFAAEYLARVLAEVRKKGNKEQFEITPEEFFILETIKVFPGLIQSELANKIAIQSSYLSKILTKLEKLNLIFREQNTRGTRQLIYKLYLTESGKTLYKKRQKIIKIKFFDKMSDEEFNENRELAKSLLEIALKLKDKLNIKF